MEPKKNRENMLPTNPFAEQAILNIFITNGQNITLLTDNIRCLMIPKYILDFFFQINHDLKKQIKDKNTPENIKKFVDDNVKNKDNFINVLNQYLQRTIDELLFDNEQTIDY